MKFNINNCNRFGQLKFALLEDDRFSEHTHGKYEAAVLYAMIENQISLSQDTYENGNSKYYDEESKKCFCIITEKSAKNFKMSSSTFKTRKKFLQEAGLISFKEQTVKKEGVATLIFVTDFTKWVEQNGLYVNGEWHVIPSSENYFNPTKLKTDEKIVKVAPKIKKQQESVVEPVEVEQEPTGDIIEESTNDTPDFDEPAEEKERVPEELQKEMYFRVIDKEDYDGTYKAGFVIKHDGVIVDSWTVKDFLKKTKSSINLNQHESCIIKELQEQGEYKIKYEEGF